MLRIAETTLIKLNNRQLARILQTASYARKHLGRIVEVMICVEYERQVGRALRQAYILVCTEHERDLIEVLARGRFLSRLEKVGKNILRNDAPRRTDRLCQIGQ